MWAELVAALEQFDDAVLSGVGPDGYPVSVRVRPRPQASDELLLLATELPVVLAPGPASVLCHRHDRRLWHLRSFLVRGVLDQSERGWVLRPTALVPGTGLAGALGDARTFLAARRRAGRYLAHRGLQRPVVPWDELRSLRRSLRRVTDQRRQGGRAGPADSAAGQHDGPGTHGGAGGADSGPDGGSAVAVRTESISTYALRSAFDEAPIGMAVVSPTGVVRHYNQALERLLQQPPREMLGRTFFDLTHPDDLPAAQASCATMQAGATRVLRHECRFLRPDGTVLWVMVSTSRPTAASGRPPHLIMHIEDISDRKALEVELTRRALHDHLTGLPNRALLLDRLTHALARTRHEVGPASLLLLDLNGFKAVNDTHGHPAGDDVLQQLAERLTALLRPEDTAARLGGDEFVVLCEHTTDDQAAVIAERLRAAVAAPFTVGTHTVDLTASVGVSTAHVHHHGPEQAASAAAALLHDADRHMYDLKRAGRRRT